MGIYQEIELIKIAGMKPHRTPLKLVPIQRIQETLDDGGFVTVISTFNANITLEEMVYSTRKTIEILDEVQKPVDILAIMSNGSKVNMGLGDISKTQDISRFTKHPMRGATVALMQGQNTIAFFLSLANRLFGAASFATAKTETDAYAYIERHRAAR